ncbi:hypothetical protein QAD02_003095 [Eretmocerus hayati]|uniref:Uncharacterized protein n=1 Tax=Eretmocerus hayati TaxID=131215 RepID=A0ACC2NLP4_9HYME|nr:hypothetical protein QAD02_003095 [Eretmocerus hayati]
MRNSVESKVQKILAQKSKDKKVTGKTKHVESTDSKPPDEERSPLKNLSNLKRKLPSSQIFPDVLGNRVEQIAELQDMPTAKTRKPASEVQVEFETRTRKQEECITQQAEIHNLDLAVANRELKYWENMEKASEMEIGMKNSELSVKACAKQVELLKLQYWQDKISENTEAGVPSNYDSIE